MTADTPMQAAHRLARALGCNLLPTEVESRRPKVREWAHLHSPWSSRIDAAQLRQWRDAEVEERRRGRERTAWALLPGSGRLAVIDSDSAEWTALWLSRAPTPLVVTSPSPGRAHLWYRWPDGVDLTPRSGPAPGTYEIKARGSTIHAPGSLHRSRLGRYACSLPASEQVPGLRDRLPVLDLALVEADAEAAGRGRYDGRGEVDFDRWSEGGEGERRFAAWVAAVPPAGEGSRQSTLYRIAVKAGDFGVTYDRARVLCEAWAASCSPPLPEDEAEGCLRRAYLARRSAVGCALGEDVSGIPDWNESEDWGV